MADLQARLMGDEQGSQPAASASTVRDAVKPHLTNDNPSHGEVKLRSEPDSPRTPSGTALDLTGEADALDEPQPTVTTNKDDDPNRRATTEANEKDQQNATLPRPTTVLNTDGSPICLNRDSTGMLIEFLPDQYKIKVMAAPASAIFDLPPCKPARPKSNTAISRAICGIMLDNIADKGCRRATIVRAGGLAYIHALDQDGTLYKFGDSHGYCSMEHIWLNSDFSTHEQRKTWAERKVEEYKTWKTQAEVQYESELQAWKEAKLNWEIELVLTCADRRLDVFPPRTNQDNILAYGRLGIRADYEAWNAAMADTVHSKAKPKKALRKRKR